MKKMSFIKQFNWRMMLVRIGLNGVTLLVVSLLPGIYFVEPTIVRILLLALVLGVLNAFVKPILQFLTLRFIFATYGFAIVIINTIILLLLSLLFPGMFVVGSLLWAIIGALVMGLVAGFLENLLGLTMPILPEEDRQLREQLADPSVGIETVLVDRGARQAEGFLADEERGLNKAPAAGPPQLEEDLVIPSTSDEIVPVAGEDLTAPETTDETPPPPDDEASPAPPTGEGAKAVGDAPAARRGEEL